MERYGATPAGMRQVTKWLPTSVEVSCSDGHTVWRDLNADLSSWEQWFKQLGRSYKVVRESGKVALFAEGESPFGRQEDHE